MTDFPISNFPSITYSDFSGSFAKHPVTKDLVKITNEESVKNSVKNIILTRFGERHFMYNFGSRVTQSLFTTYTPAIGLTIKSEIINVLQKYEPRINVIDVKIDDTLDYHLMISIVFSIINSTKNVQVDILMERTR